MKQRQITSEQGLLALVRRKPLITHLMGVNGQTAVSPLPLTTGAAQVIDDVRATAKASAVARAGAQSTKCQACAAADCSASLAGCAWMRLRCRQ